MWKSKGLLKGVGYFIVGGGLFLVLTQCSAPFDFNNPVDPKSDSYQGFETVGDPNDVESYVENGVELIWPEFTISKVEGADSYELEIAEDEDFSGEVYSSAGTNESFNNHVMRPTVDLSAGSTYYWRGRAVKDGTTGEWTEARSFTMKDLTDSMSPTDGTMTADTTPTLSWDAVDGAEKYELQIADTENGIETSTAKYSTSADYTTTNPLTNYQDYYWRVRAVNGDGVATAWSSIYSFNVNWGEITAMSPADGTTTADTTPALSWNAVDGAENYELQIADSEVGVETADAINASGTEYTPALSLSNNQSHHWRVRAVNGDGVATEWSSIYTLNLTDTPSVGDYGQAGGLVYYDKGSYSDGWRYLEAAPASTEWDRKQWGDEGTEVGGDAQLTSIGDGQAATDAIGAHMESKSITRTAAQLCDGLTEGGYSDWFLPSKDELNEMYENLYKAGIGSFEPHIYWSSSEENSIDAWWQYFDNGNQHYYHKVRDYGFHVRASRAF